MKKLLLSVIALMIMSTVSFGSLNIGILPPAGEANDNSSNGREFRFNSGYTIICIELGEVFETNGYDVDTPFEYLGAFAVSPDGYCEVTRVHSRMWEVKVYFKDAFIPLEVTVDFFLNVIIDGVDKNLTYRRTELAV